MDLQLQGKTALVTASSGGIGMEVARRLAREGAIVAVNGRTQETVSRACEDIRSTVPDARLVPLVSDNGTAAGCRRTIAELPEVDILVNNLGIYQAVRFFDTTDGQWRRLYEVNVLSGVRLCRHYLKGMLDRNSGRIVFISSEAAVSPAPEMAHYSATKLMMLSLSRSLAELTRGSAVTVNSVLPGSTRTSGVETFIREVFPEMEYGDAERRFMKENRPTSLIERLILPQEIAAFVAFICSPLASAVNGASLRADGGLVRNVI